jgi:hypothetical protein
MGNETGAGITIEQIAELLVGKRVTVTVRGNGPLVRRAPDVGLCTKVFVSPKGTINAMVKGEGTSGTGAFGLAPTAITSSWVEGAILDNCYIRRITVTEPSAGGQD